MDDGLDANGFLSPERVRGLFDRAVALWNAGEFFEAHEDWERIWHEAEGDRRTWLQGLIQFAAALHHVQQGTASGFTKLVRSASDKCGGYAGDTHGVDFAALWADLGPWRDHAARVAAGAPFRAGLPPFPVIRYVPGWTPSPLPVEAAPAGEDDDDGDAR